MIANASGRMLLYVMIRPVGCCWLPTTCSFMHLHGEDPFGFPGECQADFWNCNDTSYQTPDHWPTPGSSRVKCLTTQVGELVKMWKSLHYCSKHLYWRRLQPTWRGEDKVHLQTPCEAASYEAASYSLVLCWILLQRITPFQLTVHMISSHNTALRLYLSRREVMNVFIQALDSQRETRSSPRQVQTIPYVMFSFHCGCSSTHFYSRFRSWVQ